MFNIECRHPKQIQKHKKSKGCLFMVGKLSGRQRIPVRIIESYTEDREEAQRMRRTLRVYPSKSGSAHRYRNFLQDGNNKEREVRREARRTIVRLYGCGARQRVLYCLAHQHMPTGTLTIEQALTRGRRSIAIPALLIFLASIPVTVLLVMYVSWWGLVMLAIGEFLSVLYRWNATARWQIRCYEQVADIHQFQRAAELAGLLPRHSHESLTRHTGLSQNPRLARLQQRFLEDPGFVDDPTIPEETSVKYQPVFAFVPIGIIKLTLNSSGIKVGAEPLLAWSDITNERLALVGATPFLRFEHRGGRHEIELGSLDIPAWKLDLLLYIYRGRFGLRQLPVVRGQESVSHASNEVL